MRVEVLEDMDVKENGHKTWVAWKYSSTRPWIKLWKKCLRTKGSCWGRSIELKLVAKAWAHKKKFTYKFSQSLVRKCLNQICISLFLIASSRKGKTNTIGVKKEKNAKLPHDKDLVPTYRMQCYLYIML